MPYTNSVKKLKCFAYLKLEDSMSDHIREHFDKIAPMYDTYKKKNSWYYNSLKKIYASIIPTGKDVIEIGCGTGEILNSLSPKYGLGIDISPKMIEIARGKFSHLDFQACAASDINAERTFDYIIMPDVIEHLDEPARQLSTLRKLANDNTRLVMTYINPRWEWLLDIMERLDMKMPEGPHNRISNESIKSLLLHIGIEAIEEKKFLNTLVQLVVAKPKGPVKLDVI